MQNPELDPQTSSRVTPQPTPQATNMETVWVALGSNLAGPLGEPLDNLNWAVNALSGLEPNEPIAVSRWYESAPVGMIGHRFLNGVMRFRTRLSADELLKTMLELENQAGRDRQQDSNSPNNRPLDLDLLLYSDRIIQTIQLQIPHPRMMERAFVLLPLLDIDPGVHIPGYGPAAEYRHRIQNQDCRPKLG